MSNDKEYPFKVNSPGHQASTLNVNLRGVELKDVLVESGSTCNVVDRETWEELKGKGIQIQLLKV